MIGTYGKLDFLEQALEKQKVTRQLINRAKFNLTCLTLFFSLISLGVISFGMLGFFESQPQELTFIIPIGVLLLWTVRNQARKIKAVLGELSKLAVGIHAEKLANQ